MNIDSDKTLVNIEFQEGFIMGVSISNIVQYYTILLHNKRALFFRVICAILSLW